MAGFTMAARGRSYQGARSAYGDYQTYPEGRPLFLPEAERFGTPPDLPSLLLQQRIIYISMPALADGQRVPYTRTPAQLDQLTARQG
ncbi:ATP-dependent Clp protease proteolytic subunit [Haematococcus lacustris]|uniref:ATP-dependent Clp protease proteolytic subunit n=1 Tax=Haematococcus lacustris TaxID=44745 RepID=A0A699YMQ5_HAELA|nr:ATP-dependent Clp protease proteolytic subunit [Haematococcus lacustris]